MTENKSSEIARAIPAEDVGIIPLDDGIDRNNKGIPLAKIIELRRKNLSLQQIADILKCSKQNIYYRLQDCEEFEGFSRDTAIHYEVLQHRIYKSITEEDIKKTPFAQRVVAMGILEDKKRLIRGQSTENIDQFSIQASLEEIRKHKKELLKELQVKDVTEEIKEDKNR